MTKFLVSGMMEKVGDHGRGLGEERRGGRPQARLIALSRFQSSPLPYKPVACKQAPDEDAKKIGEQSESTSTKLKNSESMQDKGIYIIQTLWDSYLWI